MKRSLGALATVGPLLAVLLVAGPAVAQKSGGILRVPFFDSPASVSLHEESTFAALRPMMGVFNNIVMYKQDVPQNSMESIIPDLATSWSWNEDGTELTFPLRQGVKWHDGKPFTAADVKCTWDMLAGKAGDALRLNPRKSWYANLDEVTTKGDDEVTFHLPPREMRLHPIGTGPFKSVEFKPNQSITLTRNPDYWKKDRPYLDGIEYTIIKNLSTAVLALVSGKFDMAFPYSLTVPLLKDVKSQMPQAICEMG